MKFYVFGMTDDLSFAFVNRMAGIERSFDLQKGVLMREHCTPEASLYLDKRKGDFLTDFLSNTLNILPISEKYYRYLSLRVLH